MIIICWPGGHLTGTEIATSIDEYPPGQPPSRAKEKSQGVLAFYERVDINGVRGGCCECFSRRVMLE